MNFRLIAAVALNGVIGNKNGLPWNLPSDLKYFKETTLGQTIIMGSNTFESIGRVLPGRRNVVITRDAGRATMCLLRGVDAVYQSLSKALEQETNNPFVIGGGLLYREAMELGPQHLFITLIQETPEGDAHFPIDGVRFLSKYVFYNNHSYHRLLDTPWREENGINYKFTGFGLDA